MNINVLIEKLKYMRNLHNVTDVYIPRLGKVYCRPISEDEFDIKWVKDGILRIEGEEDD